MRTSLLPGLAAGLRQAQHQQHKSFAQFEARARVHRRAPASACPKSATSSASCSGASAATGSRKASTSTSTMPRPRLEAIVRPLAGRAPETRIDPQLGADAPRSIPSAARASIWVNARSVCSASCIRMSCRRSGSKAGRSGRCSMLRRARRRDRRAGPSARFMRFRGFRRRRAISRWSWTSRSPAGEVADALRAAAGAAGRNDRAVRYLSRRSGAGRLQEPGLPPRVPRSRDHVDRQGGRRVARQGRARGRGALRRLGSPVISGENAGALRRRARRVFSGVLRWLCGRVPAALPQRSAAQAPRSAAQPRHRRVRPSRRIQRAFSTRRPLCSPIPCGCMIESFRRGGHR